MRDFQVFADIKHLNIRKQGEDAEVLAIDIKLQANVPAQMVDDLMCEGINEGFCIGSFWLKSEDGAPAFPQLGEVPFDRDYRNLRVKVLGLELEGVSIKKFRFKAIAGEKAELTFQATVEEPPAKTVDLLASQLASMTIFEFCQPQADLLDVPVADSCAGSVKIGKVTVSADPDTEPDPLYNDAVATVLETRKASVSWVQRRMSVGYNRAARMVERMESEGIVGPSGPGGEREILKAASVSA